MSRRLRPSSTVISFGFLVLTAATATATPTISITSPALGTTVRNFPKPTISVAYSSTDPSAPLDLASLTITVNGVDRTTLFTKGPDSATWTLGPDDELPGGTVTLYASMRDTATPPGQADTTQSNEVLPSLRDVQLRQGDPGDTITVTAFGLDPAGTNVLTFGSLFSTLPIEAPLVTFDPVTHTGTVAIPQDAATGNVSLKVNGRTSPESVYFVVKAPFHMCGSPLKMLGLADGSLLVLYEYYYNFGGLQDPACPVSPGDANVQHARVVLSYGPTGTAAVAAYTDTSNYFDVVSIFDIAVDKAGLSAVLKQGGCCTPATILYNGTPTTLPSLGFSHVYGPGYGVRSDFDSQGNLYLALTQPVYVPASNSFVYALDLYKVSSEALVAGGEAVPQLVGRIEPEHPGLALVDFRVSCDGFGYLAASGGTATAPAQFLRKVDLASGGGVWTVDAPPYPVGLTLTCNTGEVFGASYDFASTVQVWRNRDGAPVELLEQLVAGPLYTPLAIAPGGAIYAPNLNGIGPLRTRVDPKIVNGTLTAQAYPCQQEGLNILPSTTRWKPQRSDSPITVDFVGPDNLNLTSGTLEITGPGSVGAITVTGPITQTSPTGPFTYSMQWTAPWTYTDPTGQVRRLPAGNYSVVVKATPQGGSQQQSTPYDKVSLVEVKSIELQGISGGAPLDGNPGPGAGARIFAESQQEPTTANQNPPELQGVNVVATIEPPIADPGAQGPVTVYFRSMDVDDPSAATVPVDDETRPCSASSCDNRVVPQAGYLFAGGGLWVDGSTIVQGTAADSGEAQTSLRTSIRQGDNHRVAASTNYDWLTGLDPVQSSQTGAVQHTSGEQVLDSSGARGPQVSEMLTVWRTLHLEVDALVSQDPLADQAAMDISGNWTRLWRSRLRDNSRPFFDPEHPNRDDWAGANLSLGFHAGDWYDVTDNTDRDVRVNVRPGQPDMLNGQRERDITDHSYILRDDDITSLDATKACGTTNCAADYLLAVDLLARAYIKLVPVVQPPADATITFVVGIHRNITSNFPLPNQVLSARTYWATQLMSAFDGDPTGDLDPRPTTGTFPVNLGLTTVGTPMNDGRHKLKSSVFVETVRDLYEKPPQGTVGGVPLVLSPEVNKRVTAHEILHTFGIGHDAAIMCSTINIQNNTVGGTITDDHIQQLRSVERPVPAPNNNQCP